MMVVRRFIRNSAFPVLVLIIAFIVINMILSPGMINGNFIQIFFSSNATLICVTIGTAIVIMGGGIDISLGALVSLVNVTLTQLVTGGMDLLPAILIALLVAAAGGILNGSIIAFLRISPMLATFASLSIFTGLALWIMPLSGGTMPKDFRMFYSGTVLGIPFALLMVLAILLATFLIHKSPLGVKIKAVGLNPENAFLSGIHVDKVQFFTYVFAGIAAGIGAIGLTANIGAGDPAVGASISMNAIASCVIGGVALSGGYGNTVGATLGSLFLALLVNTVLSAQIPAFYQDLVSGAILLMGMVAASVIANRTIAKAKN